MHTICAVCRYTAHMVTKVASTSVSSATDIGLQAIPNANSSPLPPDGPNPTGRLRRLTLKDAARVSELAQTYRWRRDCGIVTLMLETGDAWGIQDTTGLVAVGASLPMGTGATICKMLVHPSQIGQGMGSRLLKHLLGHSEADFFCLNATDEGVPLYASQGFTPDGQVVMGKGKPDAYQPTKAGKTVHCEVARPQDLQVVAQLDRAATGVNRSPLLHHIYATAEQIAVSYNTNGQPAGYAVRWFNEVDDAIGPIVATNADEASALVAYLARGVRAGETRRGGTPCSGIVRVDAVTPTLPGHTATSAGVGSAQDKFVAWLQGLAVTDLGILTRMVRGARPTNIGGQTLFGVYAHATD